MARIGKENFDLSDSFAGDEKPEDQGFLKKALSFAEYINGLSPEEREFLDKLGLFSGSKVDDKRLQQIAQLIHERTSPNHKTRRETKRTGFLGSSRQETRIFQDYTPPEVEENPITHETTTFKQRVLRDIGSIFRRNK